MEPYLRDEPKPFILLPHVTISRLTLILLDISVLLLASRCTRLMQHPLVLHRYKCTSVLAFRALLALFALQEFPTNIHSIKVVGPAYGVHVE
jgi:hypothetical protein